MAWLINQNSVSMRYLPKITATPACPDRAALRAFQAEHGFLPTGVESQGNPIDEPFWPQSGQFAVQLKCRPRLLGLCSFFLVPQSWRDIIEDLEPNIHQFKHVPLSLRNGDAFDEAFFALNIRRALRNVCDMTLSTGRTRDFGDGHERFLKATSHPEHRVVMNRDAIAGKHLWLPLDLITYPIAMSDELFSRVAALGGVETIEALEVSEV